MFIPYLKPPDRFKNCCGEELEKGVYPIPTAGCTYCKPLNKPVNGELLVPYF